MDDDKASEDRRGRLEHLVREMLTCRNGAAHYCPNCDNTIDADKLLALLTARDATPAPPEDK